MRIEAYNQVSQLYQVNKSGKSQATGRVNRCDQVQISKAGRDYQTAKAAVADAADVREELTAPIKNRIQSGTYDVSGEDFASKLLQKYNEMR